MAADPISLRPGLWRWGDAYLFDPDRYYELEDLVMFEDSQIQESVILAELERQGLPPLRRILIQRAAMN